MTIMTNLGRVDFGSGGNDLGFSDPKGQNCCQLECTELVRACAHLFCWAADESDCWSS